MPTDRIQPVLQHRSCTATALAAHRSDHLPCVRRRVVPLCRLQARRQARRVAIGPTDDNDHAISLAENMHRQRDAVADGELPSWGELANADACAACLGLGGVVVCDDCKCGFHPTCQATLLQLSAQQILALPHWYCAVCRPTWTHGLPVGLVDNATTGGSSQAAGPSTGEQVDESGAVGVTGCVEYNSPFW